jgi:prepilin peptidase CpaA
MLELAVILAFGALMVIAAGSDVATMTIPNWVSIALVALFFPAALLTGMHLTTLALHVGFAALVLAACFGLFLLGIMGGGDAKLIGAAALWTGFSAFGVFAGWTVLVGGLIALLLLFVRRWFKPNDARPAFVNRLLKLRGGVPYGVAIMVGGLAVMHALPFAGGALTLP